MKNILQFFCLLLMLSSCSNGLNKPIIEPLSVDELKINMKKDTSFTEFYSTIQELREFLLKSDMTQAKYADVTYKRVWKYIEKCKDTTFQNAFRNNQRELYDSQYPSYKNEVDSILTYWGEYKNKHTLDSLVSIEYFDLWKEYYSYSGDVKSVNIGFKVTPLKGTIDQLIFKYNIKPKISDDGSIGYFNSHRCLASSPIYSPKTLYWEADYSDEKYLKYKSSSEVAKEYAFNIEIVEVRMQGKNMSDELDIIPECVSDALKYGTGSMMEYYSDDIIKELIDPDYMSFYDFYTDALNNALKKIDPEVFTMLDEYSKDYYENIEN